MTLVLGGAAGPAQQPVVLETGYTVTPLPAGIGSAGLACSPGGSWGDYLYVADSAAGTIERLDFEDNVSSFAGPFGFPVGLAFGPGPVHPFGDRLYVGDFQTSRVSSVTSGGTVAPFASFPAPGALAFDPLQIYGTGLIAASRAPDSIRTIGLLGSSDLFSAAPADYLAFGPGGAWGTGLYATDRHGSVGGPNCCFDHGAAGCSEATCRTSVCDVAPSCCVDTWDQACANLALEDPDCPCTGRGPGIVQVDAAGLTSPFVDGFLLPQGLDWAVGAGWNGDLFVADLGAGAVRRLSPGGIRTDFAIAEGVSDLSFCNCSLYLASLSGGRWKITSDADDPDMDGTGTACDDCPGFHDPPGVIPPFSRTIVASSRTTFSWPDAVDVRYVRGPLADVSSYGTDFVQTAGDATSFSDPAEPSLGAGFYYLAQPDCAESSWQTALGAEPARDLSLP